MPIAFIPPALRTLTDGADRVSVSGETVRETIRALEVLHPGIAERLCEGDSLKPGLAVSIDGRMGRAGLSQKVGPASEVHFLPAIGGGS